NADKAPADSRAYGYRGGGDAGRGRVEHRSFTQLVKLYETGYQENDRNGYRIAGTYPNDQEITR
ncbi:MAG: hypothetical protein ACOC38_04875, partial [Promethearchaeia archaeon]